MKTNSLFHALGMFLVSLISVIPGVLIVFMTLLITVDVIGRGIFSSPTRIADAAAGYTLVGITFLGLACTELAGKHVTIGILTNRLPPKVSAPLEVAILIITLTFTIWFTYLLFVVTKQNYINHVVSIDALNIEVWIPNSLGPLGTGMYATVLLVKLIQKLRSLINKKTDENGTYPVH